MKTNESYKKPKLMKAFTTTFKKGMTILHNHTILTLAYIGA